MAAKIWISWKKSSLKIWASTRDTFVLGRDSNLGLSAINFFVLPSAADLFDFEQEVKLRFHFAAAADNGAKEFRQPSDTGRAISDLKKQKPEIVLRVTTIHWITFFLSDERRCRSNPRPRGCQRRNRNRPLSFHLTTLISIKNTFKVKASQENARIQRVTNFATQFYPTIVKVGLKPETFTPIMASASEAGFKSWFNARWRVLIEAQDFLIGY